MVKCFFCAKYASLKFKTMEKIKYACVNCVKTQNIQNAYSRLHCEECLVYGGWIYNKKRYCYLHKPLNSKIASPKCIVCHIFNATFGFENKSPEYCHNCMDKSLHINVKTKKCINCGIKNAYFKKNNESPPKSCGDCKTPDMRSIKSKYCNTVNCNSIAYYGYIGMVASKCNEHKEPFMHYLKEYAFLSNTKYTTLKNKKKHSLGIPNCVYAK